MLSKFLVGQFVSGYTTQNRVFEGNIFINKNNEKVVLSENGKWLPLIQLKSIKRSGRKLKEEAEEAINSVLSKLSPEKVQKNINNLEDIAKKVTTAAGIPEADANRKDIEKYTQEQLIGLKTIEDAEKGGNADAIEKASKELEKIQKTPEELAKDSKEDSIKEAYLKNRSSLLNHKKLHERKIRLGEDAMYDINEEYDDFDDDLFIDDNFNDSFEGTDFYDEIEDDYTDDYEDDLLAGNDFEYDAAEDDNLKNDIDIVVDEDFENALDDYEAHGGDYNDELMIESLAKAFGGNAEKALKETSNIPDAVCHLAEQVKAIRINELKRG